MKKYSILKGTAILMLAEPSVSGGHIDEILGRAEHFVTKRDLMYNTKDNTGVVGDYMCFLLPINDRNIQEILVRREAVRVTDII